MSVHATVTKEDLIRVGRLAEKQKNQRVIKNTNKFLKQTHYKKLAENFQHITERLEEVNKSTKEQKKILKGTILELKNQEQIVAMENDSDISEDENDVIQSLIKAVPNCSTFSIPMKKKFGFVEKQSQFCRNKSSRSV